MVFIYTIKLKQGKYYIGKTTNPKFRLNTHFNYNGSAWTKQYKPIEIIELISNCDDYDEDKITLKYMEKYGIDNVRGGSFVQITLNAELKNTIKRMITSTNNKCFICKKPGHFANSCKHKQNKTQQFSSNFEEEYYSESEEEFDSDEYDSESEEEFDFDGTFSYKKKNNYYKKSLVNCYRCGRKGHYASSCFAVKHVKGYYIN